jgi:aspartate kinase
MSRSKFPPSQRKAPDTSLSLLSNVDLSTVGEDISISPPVNGVTKVAMKFGGSSLATAERVLYVAKLIMKHVEQGYQPTIVCSAMGKTTNTLLSAGEFALQGSVNVDSLRTLHLSVANALGLSNNTIAAVEELLDELERLLEGVKYIGELTPRTKVCIRC